MVSALITWGLVPILTSSFAVCALLILTQRWHGKHSLDHDLCGVQKIHQTPVPRVGGVGLAIGLVIGAFEGSALGGKNYPAMVQLLVCAIPVFAAGLMEDLTKKVSVRARLYASFASAGAAAWLLNAYLTQLHTPLLDWLVAFAPFAVVFTCIAIGGMTHAINIIDGLNGLAAGCVVLMLTGLVAIAWQVGDILVMKLCIWGIAALLGFLILNFPFGWIFLGDGGAYLAGFWLAECGVLLLNRNPSVSTWAVLLCSIYPFWETIFSIYRRHVLNRVSSGQPDMIHLHHLIYRHISSEQLPLRTSIWWRHGISSMIIWALTALYVLIAAYAYNDTPLLIFSALSFIVLYSGIYQYILRGNDVKRPHTLEPTIRVKRS